MFMKFFYISGIFKDFSHFRKVFLLFPLIFCAVISLLFAAKCCLNWAMIGQPTLNGMVNIWFSMGISLKLKPSCTKNHAKYIKVPTKSLVVIKNENFLTKFREKIKMKNKNFSQNS